MFLEGTEEGIEQLTRHLQSLSVGFQLPLKQPSGGARQVAFVTEGSPETIAGTPPLLSSIARWLNMIFVGSSLPTANLHLSPIAGHAAVEAESVRPHLLLRGDFREEGRDVTIQMELYQMALAAGTDQLMLEMRTTSSPEALVPFDVLVTFHEATNATEPRTFLLATTARFRRIQAQLWVVRIVHDLEETLPAGWSPELILRPHSDETV